MSMLHHPPEDLLLSYAAGSLDEAYAVTVATHLALCPACRGAVLHAEAIGGELMEQLAPASLDMHTLSDVMARLDDAPVVQGDKAHIEKTGAVPSAEVVRIPRPLRDYITGDLTRRQWRWQGSGVHYAPLTVDAQGNKMGLMRIAAGTSVPHHGHSGEELTLVLEGGYSDEMGRYGRGDMEFADASVRHQPVADADGECLCLVVTRGKLKPTGILARWITPLVSF